MSDPVVIKLFKKLLDEATNSDNLEADTKKINTLVNMINEKMICGKISMEELRKKVLDKNPHTVYYALLIMEEVVQHLKTVHDTNKVSDNILDILKKLSVHTRHEKIMSKTMFLMEELEKYQDSQKLFDKNVHTRDKCESEMSDNDFQGNLKKIQMDQKAKYKAYLKSLGKATSSDEEEEKEEEEKEIQNSYFKTDPILKLNICQKVDNLAHEMKKKLPKDLEISKNQRKQLATSASKIRAIKHQSYVEDHAEVFCRSMRQCAQENCADCKRYKKATAPEEPLPKQLPYEMRKVKESKLRIRSVFEDIKKEKQKEYYHKVKPF
ncbi:uncharacterized protein LOC106657032 [Trichogramma pretiosum]|uniref:uncharacterized protein LOC106657032 n=1 Tax=Trichogramma pretiosum TaxID=7493 RepID=UPI000C71A176|nr:uncharacterized protein LOC106657032 [Trichogramma pretiosum]